MTTQNSSKKVDERTDGFTRLSAFFHNSRLPLTFKETIKTDTAQGIGGFCSVDPQTEGTGSCLSPTTAEANRPSKAVENSKQCSVDGGARCLVAPNEEDTEVFFKMSSSASTATLSHFEWMTAKQLLDSCSYLPYFMRQYGFMKNKVIMECVFPDDELVDLEERQRFNPFDLTQPVHVDRFGDRARTPASVCTAKYLKKSVVDIGVYESLRGCKSAAESLRRSGEEVKASFTYQLMMAVLMAQQRINFAHCDLHWDNVFVVKCDPRLQILFQYKRRDNTMHRRIIPTHGVMPVIIDYGFSYSKSLEGYYPEVLYADNHGYITYEMDDTVDVVHLLSEYANYSKSSLAREVGLFLKEVGVKRGRDVAAGERFRPSWEDVNRRFVCGAYQAILSVDRGRKADWLWNMVYDAMVRSSSRNVPVPYDTRIRDLKLQCLVNATPDASFIGVDVDLLEKYLRVEIYNVCIQGTGQDRMYSEILDLILLSLSKAVRISSSGVEVPVTVQNSKKWHKNKVLPEAAAAAHANDKDGRDSSDDTTFVTRIKLDHAHTHFTTSLASGFSLLCARYKSDGNTAMIDTIRMVQNNLTRSVCDCLLSATYALTALVSRDSARRAEQLCTFVKQGLCIPLRPYSNAQACTVDNAKKNTLKFIDAFDAWAQDAGPNMTRVSDEITNVVLRFLSECIRKNTVVNHNCGGKCTVDIGFVKSDFLANVDEELKAFNLANSSEYSKEVDSAIARIHSFEVDWYEIIRAQTSNVSMAGTMFEANVSKLRNFKNSNIRDKLKSGEEAFFRYERALHDQCRPFKERRPISTPLLVIDAVEHEATMTTLEEILRKKKADGHGVEDRERGGGVRYTDVSNEAQNTSGPKPRPALSSKRKLYSASYKRNNATSKRGCVA